MPTITQLPEATAVAAADTIPVSQSGTAKSVSVGTLLGSVQPAINIASPSLIGRTSLGSGAPEQIGIGEGLALSSARLVANGLDHGSFPAVAGLTANTDLVISSQGSPGLMPASLLRGLFSAGPNISITANGTISATGSGAAGAELGSAIATLQVVSSLAAQDLIAVSQSGLDRAIEYVNLIDGITIDQAQPAQPASDTDTIWASQGSNVMTRQTLSALWTWLAGKMPAYKSPVVELTSNTNLDSAAHNGRILVCSQPITLTPVTSSMVSGFSCTVINMSAGSVTLGSGFLTSTGGSGLGPLQSADIYCVTYSQGSFPYAAISGAAVTVSLPGQVTGLASTAAGQSSITLAWSAPTAGGSVTSYIVAYQTNGATSWTTYTVAPATLTYQLTGLQPATSYNITVQACNAAGSGAMSSVLTVATSAAAQAASVPAQVSGLTASSASSSSVQLTWTAQTGTSAASSYTVQYRTTGLSGWTSTIAGITANSATVSGLQAGTSYDFSVSGTNAAGSGPTSGVATAVTAATANSVSSITWNLVPSGTYNRSSGAIGVNAFVSPGTSAVQFGFALSATTPPTSWTQASLVNSNLWGAYVPTPGTAGTWFAWGEGVDGSARTVSSATFTVE
jgi:hypothetical protein